MRAQAAAALSMWSTSSSATTLIHRRVVSTVLPSSSSRLFPRLCRSISNRNNSSSSLTCNPTTTILPVSNSKMVVDGRRRWLSVRASNVSEPGSIDSPMILSMQAKINEQLEADSVVVKDANGDGRHVSIEVVSKLFEGKSSVNRQRMVYKAIWEELQSTVHAVDQMTTQTPEEAKK